MKVASAPSGVLVTGANGYLGSAIMDALAEADIPSCGTARRAGTNVSILADLLAPESLTHLTRAVDPTHIIHTAAIVPDQLAAYNDAAAANANVKITETVIALAKSKDISVSFISSMTVYGADATNPVKEDDISGPPTSAYAQGKRRAEQLFQQSGLRGNAIRIPGLYGGARAGGLVTGLRNALQKGDVPRLPDQPLQWAAMHVKDAAAGIAAICNAPSVNFEPVNLGYAGPISINRLTQIAAKQFDRKIENPVAHPVFAFDLTRFEELTGLASKSFDQAIEEFLA